MLNKFICSLSNTDDHHYITRNPLKLECKHYACYECYKNHAKDEYFTCIKCGFCSRRICRLNLSIQSDKDFKNSLDENFDDIAKEIKLQYDKAFYTFQEKKERNNAEVDYLIEEIDVKAESRKVEVDFKAEKLKRQFEFMKEELNCLEPFDDNNNTDNSTDNNISNPIQFELNQIQKKTASIRKSIKDLENMPEYEINESQLSQSIILDKKKDQISEHFSHCPVFMRFSIRDFAVLPNGDFCFVQNDTIAVYNQSFEEISARCTKEMRFNDERLKQDSCDFFGIVSDDANNLYVTDSGNKCIIKFNSNIDIISFVQCDQYGVEDVESGNIFYCNGHLYVTDENGKISKWTTGLDFLWSKQVNGRCFGFLNNTLCAVDSMLHFYQLEPFEYMFSHDLKHVDYTVFVLNDNFYVQPYNQDFAYIFDDKAIPLRKVDSKFSKLSYSIRIEKIANYNGKCFIKVYENETRAIFNSYTLMLV